MAIEPRVLKHGRSDEGSLVSAEDFAGAGFVEPRRYGREDGRSIALSPDSEAHDDRPEPLRGRLGHCRILHAEIVRKAVSEAWVRLEDGADRIGDIGVHLGGERSEIPRPARVPEVMHGIVSPGREAHDRDHAEKRRESYRAAILGYAIIDGSRRRFMVNGHGLRGYRKRFPRPGDVYASPLLPGLAIPVAEILGV